MFSLAPVSRIEHWVIKYLLGVVPPPAKKMLGTEFSVIKHEMPYSEPSSLLPTEHGGDSIVRLYAFGSE